MENITEIIRYIISIAKEMGVDKNNFSFNDCDKILKSSKKLENYLDTAINSLILEEEIDSIKSEFVRTILRIYIDKKDIQVVDTKEEIESDEETLDIYKIYKRQVSKFPVLKREEERELFKAYRDGDEEAKKMINMCNQRLVVSIAKSYVTDGYDFLTAIQDGNLGLLKAIEEFDVSLGYKFSTFATTLIHQAIYIQKNYEVSSMPVSASVVKALSHYNELERKHVDLYGESIEDEEAATLLKVSVDKLNALKNLNNSVTSLNQTVSEEEETELIDFVEDYTYESVEGQVFENDRRNVLEEALNILNEQERFVISERFGLNGGGAKTLEEVGHMLNVTRERIRQVEAQALRKLRHPSISGPLREYLYK